MKTPSNPVFILLILTLTIFPFILSSCCTGSNGGGTTPSTPARLEICAVTDDGRVWHMTQHPSQAQTWREVTALDNAGNPGQFVSVDCASLFQTIVIVGVTADQRLFLTSLSGNNWTPWSNIGAALANPNQGQNTFREASISTETNGLRIFVTELEAGRWQVLTANMLIDNSFSPNRFLSFTTTGNPDFLYQIDATMGASPTMEFIGVDNARRLWLRSRSAANSWGAFNQLSPVTFGPAEITQVGNSIHIVAQSGGGVLHQIVGGGGFTSVPVLSSGITHVGCTSIENQLNVCAISNGRILHTTRSASDAWQPPTPLPVAPITPPSPFANVSITWRQP